MLFNLVFLILANFCFVFGSAISLVYRQKSVEKQRSLDHQRHQLRLHYTINAAVSFLVLIGLMALYALPYFTNVLYYK